jgi:hypothetical protein
MPWKWAGSFVRIDFCLRGHGLYRLPKGNRALAYPDPCLGFPALDSRPLTENLTDEVSCLSLSYIQESAVPESRFQFWRVAVSGAPKPERAEAVGSKVLLPVTSRVGRRLVKQRGEEWPGQGPTALRSPLLGHPGANAAHPGGRAPRIPAWREERIPAVLLGHDAV